MVSATLGTPVNVVLQMTLVQCATCAVPFGVPTEFCERRQKDGTQFFCPSGHKNSYASEHAKLKKLLDEAQIRVSRAQQELTAEKQAHEALQKKLLTERQAHEALRKKLTEKPPPQLISVRLGAEDDLKVGSWVDIFVHLVKRIIADGKRVPLEWVRLRAHPTKTVPLGDKRYLYTRFNDLKPHVQRASAILGVGLVVQFDNGDKCHFPVKPPPSTVQDRVLLFLKDKPEGATTHGVAVGIGAKFGTVSATLSITTKNGLTERVSEGTYRLKTVS